MTETVRSTLVGLLGDIGLSATGTDELAVADSTGKSVGILAVVREGMVDMLEISTSDQYRVPLCSPMVLDMLLAKFLPGLPRIDPNS